MPVDRLRMAVEADRRADYREAMGHVRACEEALHADGPGPRQPTLEPDLEAVRVAVDLGEQSSHGHMVS